MQAAVEGDDHVEHARLQREPGLGRLDAHGATVVGVRHAADEPRRLELVEVAGEGRPLDADRTRELLLGGVRVSAERREDQPDRQGAADLGERLVERAPDGLRGARQLEADRCPAWPHAPSYRFCFAH